MGATADTVSDQSDDTRKKTKDEGRVSAKKMKADRACEKEIKAASGGKPVKWKKIIIKELKSVGGQMKFKKLRSEAINEALAHPTHKGRRRQELEDDFDREVTNRISRLNRFTYDGKVLKL